MKTFDQAKNENNLDYYFAQARYCRLVIVVINTESKESVIRLSTRFEEGKITEAKQRLIDRANNKLGTNFEIE